MACSSETAARNAARIAAVHNTARVTYGELDARSNRIAHRLRRLGVKPNDFVAILDERGLDLLAAMLGILKAGGAFVPLDPAYPSERIRYMLADSRVQILDQPDRPAVAIARRCLSRANRAARRG